MRRKEVAQESARLCQPERTIKNSSEANKSLYLQLARTAHIENASALYGRVYDNLSRIRLHVKSLCMEL